MFHFHSQAIPTCAVTLGPLLSSVTGLRTWRKSANHTNHAEVLRISMICCTYTKFAAPQRVIILAPEPWPWRLCFADRPQSHGPDGCFAHRRWSTPLRRGPQAAEPEGCRAGLVGRGSTAQAGSGGSPGPAQTPRTDQHRPSGRNRPTQTIWDEQNNTENLSWNRPTLSIWDQQTKADKPSWTNTGWTNTAYLEPMSRPW